MVDGIRLASPYGRIINNLKYLLEEYEQRAHTTALHGLEVLPSGVAIGIIIVLILLGIIITAGVIGLLCSYGVIFKSHTVICRVAPYVFVVGLIVGCIAMLIVFGSCTVHYENGELQPPDDPVG